MFESGSSKYDCKKKENISSNWDFYQGLTGDIPGQSQASGTWQQSQDLAFSRSYDKMKKTMKEKDAMSYVGILVSYHGVVAFSDSRNSFMDMYSHCEFISDDVKKVFEANDFLFVTYGVGTVFDRNKKPHPLEEILNASLSQNSGSYRKFFCELYNKFHDHFALLPDSEFHFIIGFRDDKKSCANLDPTTVVRGKHDHRRLR